MEKYIETAILSIINQSFQDLEINFESHFHNFNDTFIFQPNLSEILFHIPSNNMYLFNL